MQRGSSDSWGGSDSAIPSGSSIPSGSRRGSDSAIGFAPAGAGDGWAGCEGAEGVEGDGPRRDADVRGSAAMPRWAAVGRRRLPSRVGLPKQVYRTRSTASGRPHQVVRATEFPERNSSAPESPIARGGPKAGAPVSMLLAAPTVPRSHDATPPSCARVNRRARAPHPSVAALGGGARSPRAPRRARPDARW